MLGAINGSLCRAARVFLGGLMLGVTALILLNVSLRYLLNYTIVWTEEITRYSLIWIVFVGGGVAAREAGHLSIEMILSVMSPRMIRLNTIAVNAISAGSCVVLGVIGWNAALSAWEFGQHGNASGVPIFWIYLAIPVGCAMFALGFLERSLKAARGEIQRLRPDSFG